MWLARLRKNMVENVLGLVLLLIYQSFISDFRYSVLKIESIVLMSSSGVAMASIQINTVYSLSKGQ